MKGSMLNRFKVGQRVMFRTNIGTDVFVEKKIDNGRKSVKVFSHKNNIFVEDFGRIVKLHRSGTHGSAEIRPEDGGKKLCRKLQHVTEVK